MIRKPSGESGALSSDCHNAITLHSFAIKATQKTLNSLLLTKISGNFYHSSQAKIKKSLMAA
jgi:hypothetical protein